jgi:sarcosine oxidase subunit alpha
MMGRLPPPYGKLIDRKKKIQFSFENHTFEGLEGDTIASALIANNKWLLSRSFKYHRPRGVLTMAGQDANTLIQLPSNPNALADKELITDGLQAKGQNYSGTLEKDRGAILGLFSRFLPVGFYYKAFFKPRGMWERWAPTIRKKAGLGIIDQKIKSSYYDKQYKFFDVVVVGGGPAGMQAAVESAVDGCEVLLIDENPILGGSLNYSRFDVDGSRGQLIREELINAISAKSNITVMTDAVCNGWFADNWMPVVYGNRLFKIRASQTILCTGSLEQPALFHNNDLPGVIMGSAAQRMIHLYGVCPGTTAVILTGNNDGYGVALDMHNAGIVIKAIVDLRDQPSYDAIAEKAIDLGLTVRTGHAVYAAHRGQAHGVGSVDIRKILRPGACEKIGDIINCDVVCMSVGYTPAYQLACQAGAQLSYNDSSAIFTLKNCPSNLQLAGSINSLWDLDEVRSEATRAAGIATNSLKYTDKAEGQIIYNTKSSPNHPWPIFPHPKGKEFVDFDEDLTISDIINATSDGYEHIQLVKRYSTCGMGPSQGRHSALAAARIVASATNRSVAETGVTTARPPFSAEKLGLSAGRSFYPKRLTNMHARHISSGAEMLQAGAWFRPAFYHQGKLDKQSCINNEVHNIRNNVGMVDVSTLGGIDLRGPDVAEFLERFYTFRFKKQPVGRARYALLTNEAGIVIDDGVACRLSEFHYYITATTGGADRVYQSMLKWNSQWLLDIDISNVTSAYCGINIAGPNARNVLNKIKSDINFSADAFPYMGVRSGNISNIPARVIRVGFVGEIGYEIHVPQLFGEALWELLMDIGQEYAIQPFGIEAQRILRLEKGHIIIGQDTDAMSNPIEIQMAWAISKDKPFFVGGRTISELERKPALRKLVGFSIDDLNSPVPQESHLVLDGKKMIGRVTSCNYSPTMRKIIGLAYVPIEKADSGRTIMIKLSDGCCLEATVTELPFYDPKSLRQEI